jgi:hypothetical protein
MNSDKRRVCGVETGYVTCGALLCALAGWFLRRATAAIQKIGEGFVRIPVVHLVENAVDVFPKSTRGYAVSLNTPGITFYLGDFSVSFVKKIPDFRRLAVNEFSTELDWAVTSWIDVSEHASANTIARFHDVDGNSGAAQMACCSQSCHAGANHDHRRI